MAVLGVNNPTLLDVTNAMDPDGSIATVAEILNETNEILADMTMMEGNLSTGHRTTIRTGIPRATWRQLYGGVQPSKSTRKQITDTTGMLEAYAEVDKDLADLNGNSNEFRLSEDRAHIEGMSQDMAETVWFGNEALNPERFTGFAPRFDDLSAENADNIIDAGGTGTDNASLWLIGWGPNTAHGIYPKDSIAGLTMSDKGQVTLESAPDGSGGRMEAYRTHYQWKNGLTVRDWRFIVRICNIDRSLLTADASTGANLPNLMFEAMELIPNMGSARFAFYSDRSITTKVRQQHENRVSSSTLTVENVGGVPLTTFHGVPLRRSDALSPDEARVV